MRCTDCQHMIDNNSFRMEYYCSISKLNVTDYLITDTDCPCCPCNFNYIFGIDISKGEDMS